MSDKLAQLALAVLLFSACHADKTASNRPAAPADLILFNGIVHTMDPANPLASAVVVRKRRIVFVGTDRDARRFAGPTTRRIDLKGAAVLPGLSDAHAHLLNLGKKRASIDLKSARSFTEVVQRVTKAARKLPPGSWIVGRGWDQTRWKTGRFPVHTLLSRAVPHHFVMLIRVDGHAVVVNQKLLKRAGITRATVAPKGGRILRRSDKEPTGVLIDNAISLVSRLRPPLTEKQLAERLLDAARFAASKGLTEVHDMGTSPAALRVLLRLSRSGKLPIRVVSYLNGYAKRWTEVIRQGPIGKLGDLVRLVGVKFFVDGALGSRGALLFDPYSDDPKDSGLQTTTTARLTRLVSRVAAHNLQPTIHAIGPKGVRIVLDVYQKLQQQKASIRPRIEHAQVVHPDDVPRFRRLNVVASMQPTHATSDMRWAEKRLGTKRISWAYSWLKLLRSGAVLAFGSDFPVEGVDPLWGIYAAVTRQNHRGLPKGGWYPGQRLSLKQALHGFTMGPAWASFSEKLRGSISRGKLADFTVLERDITKNDHRTLLSTAVLMTIVDGRVVWKRAGLKR